LEKIMKIIKYAITAVLAAITVMSFADTSPSGPEAALRQLVEKRMGEGVKVDSITKTSFSDLYEVRIGNEIMYTDANAKYMVIGHVVDLETHKDYTRDRLDDLKKIKFSDLPFDQSIKMVRGNGKRVVAVFEDPNCGYCKRLRHTLAGMDNVTVYTFMYNILAEDSFVKSKNIWCAPDRLKAWDDWMLSGKAAAAAPATCKADPNEKILALGQKLHITGTPAIFFADGTRSPGALDAAALEEKFAAIQ
jgi:thiol:disulfide interchange protein DsbC